MDAGPTMAVCVNVSEAHAMLSNIQMHSDVCVCVCVRMCVCGRWFVGTASHIGLKRAYYVAKDTKRITKDEPHARFFLS